MQRIVLTKKRNRPFGRKAGIAVALAALLLLLTGCSGGGNGGNGGKLAFKDVALATDPATPMAKRAAKLTVTVNKSRYAAQKAEVQLQINSARSLPQLIDAAGDGGTYTASYVFPSAGDYAITIHMQYPAEHYAFARTVKVTE